MNYVMNTLKTQCSAIALKSLVIFCFMLAGTTNAQNVTVKEKKVDFTKPMPSANAGVLSFETEEIDYGTIEQNADGLRTFKFTNTGSMPIVITQVKTSCGCTSPTYSKEPVLAGATGEIQIKYATNRVGKFTKTVTIMSNASEPTKVLRIKGEVLGTEE